MSEPAGPASAAPEATIQRYSGLARQAAEGGTLLDREAGTATAGCFGAAAHTGADAPQAALRASLGCGNPLAVADLRPGETVLDLGSGGDLDARPESDHVAGKGLDGVMPGLVACSRP
ncbi:hypothetical protein ABGB18_46130 [Nonomuraea sp. B12E4]|uniref:hypothetical protein n=1 Tax=Nonomuraea sp. B12E4 TaxID=3153564 RepID=UPI00325C6AAE